jgi:hypothetical protein
MSESIGAVQDDTKVADQVAFEMPHQFLQTRRLSEVRIKLPSSHAVRSAAAELGAAVLARDRIRAAEALERMGILAVSRAPEQHFGRLEFSVAAVTGPRRLILIVELAVIAAEMGVLQRARAYLAASQAASPGPLEAHDLHTVGGILALNNGDLARACEELFASVYVCRGIGNLVARGPLPNFTLARRLLEVGEETPVMAYLRRCQQCWNNCADAIGQWIGSIQQGLKPATEPELFTETNSWTLTLKMQALSANSVGSMGRTAFSIEEMNEARAERQRDSAAAMKGRLGMSRS